MASIADIQSGRQRRPRRTLIYGTEGIGKSSFGAEAPKPIFIPTEDGLDDIECDRFPKATNYDEVVADLVALYQDKHSFKTVVIDSLDWLERLIWEKVGAERTEKGVLVPPGQGVGNIEGIGYGKGYTFALAYWREILEGSERCPGLSALRDDKGMSCILVAHAKIERFENPETEPYDRYSPALHKKAAALVQEWSDEVLFASYKVFTKATDEGFNRKRVQGIGGRDRVLRTIECPAFVAKNRLGLPAELPFKKDESYAAYAAHFVPEAKKGGVAK